jgi:hypothetical protein
LLLGFRLCFTVILDLDVKRLFEHAHDVILNGYIEFHTADAQSPVPVPNQANVDLPIGGTLNHCHRL